MFRPTAVFAVWLACAALAPAAQSPTFRSGTDLVTVDVLVTDAHGKAVSDLTAGDFRIVEKGRAQTIDTFSFVRVPLVARTEITRDLPIRDVVTNAVPSHSRVFAIVIDDLHLIANHQVQTRAVLTDVLSQIPPTDRVAIIFTGRSDLSIDFTTDFASEIRAVDRVRTGLGLAMDPTPVACGPREMERQHAALGTIDVLTNVVKALSQTRADERSVIYVSEGFNHDMTAGPADARRAPGGLGGGDLRTCSPDGIPAVLTSQSALPGNPPENIADTQVVLDRLKAVFQLAERKDVRIYTIDPRGNAPVDDAFVGWNTDPDLAPQLRSKVMLQNDFLRTVAERTGGLAEVQRSDLKGGIREILEDTGSYYLLGYRPDPLVRDGQYHEVQVTTTRPGLKLRSKKGYESPEAKPKALSPIQSLAAGLTSAVADDGLTLAAFVAPIAESARATRMAVTVEVFYPGPSTLPASIDDDLQYEVIAGDVEGKARVVSQHAFHFTMTPTRAGDVAFLIDDAFDLPHGISNLRLGLVSRTSGRVGTVSMPVIVPDLSDHALQLPSVVIGIDAHEAVMRGEALKGLVPFQPTVSRTFTTADVLRVFAPVSGGSKTTSASAAISVTGPAGTGPGTPLDFKFDVVPGGAIDRVVPLAGLAPGDYVLTVSAHAAGGTPVRRAFAFHLDAKR